jgi:hypothetical protein
VVGGGTISVGPTNGPYASNTVVVLTANASAHWAFDHWTGDVMGSQNPVSLTMGGPRSVEAVFVPTAFPLTAITPGGGTVSVNAQIIPPATFFPVGSVVTVTAVASNGWSFLGWQGDASATNNPLSLTLNQTNNVQGIFGTAVATNAVGGGGIVLSQPNPIPYGTVLTASAVPDAGKYFLTWSGAASGTNAPTTIAVTSANPTVSALFTTLPGGENTLSVVVMGNGSVAISPQQNYYNSGGSVTLSASTTNAGTSFHDWTKDASGSNNPIVVVVSTNKIVQANFGGLPTVNISPQNLIVFGGSNAVLNANAAGLPPLSYQWQNGQGVIAGATNASYTIFGAQATNSGNYSVIVSNPFGSVTSGVATVTVVFPPLIPNPVLYIAPMSFLAFSNLTLGGVYQLQQSVGWYWSNQPVSFTATNALYTQMVAGVADSGDYRLALNPVPAQAFATAQVVNGFVVGATVTSGGSGYVTSPAVTIVGGGGTNATAISHISGGVVTSITITDAGIGYTNPPTLRIAPPPAAAVSPTVLPVMRVDSANLAPYDNYQIQFKPDLGGTWGNWNGGLFSPTDVTNSQYLFITNGVGFFRLEYLQNVP